MRARVASALLVAVLALTSVGCTADQVKRVRETFEFAEGLLSLFGGGETDPEFEEDMRELEQMEEELREQEKQQEEEEEETSDQAGTTGTGD